MTRNVLRMGTAALVLLLTTGLFPGCSGDDPACPEPPQGTGLSSTVLAPRPRPSSYNHLFSPGPLDLFVTTYRGRVLRRHLFKWKEYDTGLASSINGIWGASANDVVAVGPYGAVSRFDGSSWQTMNSGTFEELNAVHGTAADDVWAVGWETIIRFDGTGWAPVTVGVYHPYPDYQDIWCAPTGEVFVLVGSYSRPSVLAFDGQSTWTELWVHERYLEVIWGTDPDNLWVADENGWIYRFDGTAWTHVHSMPGFVKGIHGTSANDVWVASGRYLLSGGITGDIARFDGTAWRSVAPPGASAAYADVQVVDNLEVYTVANNSMLLGWDEGRWRILNDVFVTHETFVSIWGGATDNLWLLDSGYAAWHTDGGNWEPNYVGTSKDLNAMWGTADNDIYAVGDAGAMVHYDGSRWNEIPHGLGATNLVDIWGTASDDIWVACSAPGQLWRYDGTSWTIEDTWEAAPGYPISLWGSARDNYYAVAGEPDRGGSLFHYDGTAWRQISLNGNYPFKVHGASASEVYFLTAELPIGGTNTLVRYKPGDHSTSVTALGANMEHLWVLGPDNVFVAGLRGVYPVVGHFDGSRLLTHTPDADTWINDIWGTGDNTVYLAGNAGTLIRVTRH